MLINQEKRKTARNHLKHAALVCGSNPDYLRAYRYGIRHWLIDDEGQPEVMQRLLQDTGSNGGMGLYDGLHGLPPYQADYKSGRPQRYGEPTAVLSRRVPESQIAPINQFIDEMLEKHFHVARAESVLCRQAEARARMEKEAL